MPTKRQKEQAIEMGWTHRKKGTWKSPYLKFYQEEDDIGATFIDQNQQFHYILWEHVIEL